MNFSKKIPSEVLNIAKTLKNGGYEAFLIGGCVRDLILNKKPKDWDFTTNAKPDQIMELFPDHVYENNFGTVGVKTRSEVENLKVIEITPYRLEGKYSDKRHPDEVVFSEKLEDDLSRRDFTINSIAYDCDKGQVIDPYKGQEDIVKGNIVTVGNPDERFGEDALRMLRAVRFSAELDFSIETETFNSIINNRSLISSVSRERIREEFTKIIMSKNPMIGLGICQKIGILPFISLSLEEMVGVSQNKEAHKYDVWEHSLRALQHAADKDFSLEVRLAALFHDVSKPETKRVEGSKTSFYGHEVIGAKVTRETLKNLSFSGDIVEKVSKLVRWHMFFSDTEEVTLSSVRRLIRNVGEENIWDLINLRKCDRIGTGRPKEEPYRLRKFQSMIEEALRDPISVSRLAINGNDLMKKFEIKSGPLIGHLLHALLEEVLEDPTKNTEKYLLERVTQLLEMPEEEIIKIGEKAKEIKAETEEKELEDLRKKRFVK